MSQVKVLSALKDHLCPSPSCPDGQAFRLPGGGSLCLWCLLSELRGGQMTSEKIQGLLAAGICDPKASLAERNHRLYKYYTQQMQTWLVERKIIQEWDEMMTSDLLELVSEEMAWELTGKREKAEAVIITGKAKKEKKAS